MLGKSERFFVNQSGVLIGIFGHGATPKNESAKEVPFLPDQPGSVWDGSKWVAVDLPNSAPVLTPSRFEWLLAFTGLDEIWEALEEAVRGSDRATYATLKAMRRSQSFRLSATLEMVDTFRAQAVALVPDIDLSETAIRAAWEQAANVKI